MARSKPTPGAVKRPPIGSGHKTMVIILQPMQMKPARTMRASKAKKR